MNKGTAKSGWWNPDHAARVAAGNSEYVGRFKGDGGKLVSAIYSNFALRCAAHRELNDGKRSVADDEEFASSQDKECNAVTREALKNKDLTSGKITIKDYNAGDIDAVYDAADMVQNIANACCKAGMSKVTTADAKQKLIREIRDTRNEFFIGPEDEEHWAGLWKQVDYVDAKGNVTNSKRIVEQNLNYLEEYVKGIK